MSLLVALWLGNAVAWAEPAVKVVGLGVVWEEVKESFGNFPTMNQMQPVKLVSVVDMGGLGIIDLNKEESTLTVLQDDSGKNLKGELGHFPKVSEDAKLLQFEIQGEEAPSAGAKFLLAKGTLAVMTGSKTEQRKSAVVPTEKGKVLKVSEGLAFTINKVGKPEWGNDPFMVELEIGRDIPEVAEIVFYDGKGMLIESSQGGSSRIGFLKKVTVQQRYTLKRKVAQLQIEVKVWTDMEMEKVPFEVKVGVGGGKP